MTITAADMAPARAIDELAEQGFSDNDFPAGLSADVETETTITTGVEAAFLTALMWAPVGMAHQVCDILTSTDRWNPFWSPTHRAIFEAIAAVLGDGSVPIPELVQARLFETGQFQRVQQVWLSVVAPTRAPLGGGVELAPLAAKVIDQWYRRGYAGLLARMAQIRETVSVEELAGHWENLTGHQQRAEELWLTKRDHLARL